MLKNNKWYVVLGVVGALGLLLGGAGIAYAQQPQPPSEGDSFFGGGRFIGRAFGRALPQGLMHRGPVQGLVKVTADLTGLSEEEVGAALKDGHTIAEVAESQGVDPQEIVDAATAEAESRMQEAVDNGRLTEEQMDQMLERLAEELPERLEQPWEPGGALGGLGHFSEGFWTAYDAVAETLGLEPVDLFTELHDGKTLAEIADEQGVEMEEVRQALGEARVETMKEGIEQAVESGRLTQEQADWIVEGLDEGYLPRGQGAGRGRGFGPGTRGCGRGRGW